MIFYIGIFITNFLFAILEFFSKKKIYYKLSFLILNFVLCFNYLNGIDWTNYEIWYHKVAILSKFFTSENLSFIEKIGAERNFILLMSIFKTLKFNYEIFQYIILSFCLGIIYIFFSEMTRNKLCAISFYFCSFMLVNYISPAMRQLLALSLFLLFLLLYEKGKKKIGLVLLLVGISFHNSLIIIALLLFFLKKEFSNKMYLFFTVFVFLINIYILNILIFLLKNIDFLNKYLAYFSNEYSGGRNFNIFIEILRVLIYLIILFYIKNSKRNSVKLNLVINMFFLNFIFNILRLKINSFERLEYYTLPFFIISITYLIEIVSKKNKYLGASLYMILSLYFFKVLLSIISYYKDIDPLRYIPYTNYIVEKAKYKTFDDYEKKIEYRKLNFNREEVLKNLNK